MWFIALLFIVFVGGGWFVGKLVGDVLFPAKDKHYSKDDAPIIINNHIVEQHLHISKDDLKNIMDNKSKNA